MLIEQKMEQIKLSSAQKQVAEFIREKRSQIKDYTIKEIANQTYTSVATVVRLAHKLGYDGFEEFKKDFLQEVHYLESHFSSIDPNYPFDYHDNIQTIANKISILAKETIDDTLSLIEHDSLQKAVWTLKKAKQIHLCAISYSLELGKLFKMDMQRLGVLVNIYDINGEELFLPSTISKDDCVLFVSYSGQIENLCTLAKIAREKGAKVIVISSLGNNELKKYADVILNISTREKLYSKIKGYSNEISIKLILDILYSCYFSIEYDENNRKRKMISQAAESHRKSTVNIMKED